MAISELADDPLRRICSHCGALVARKHTRWANQYGEQARFFCDVCGMWEDRMLLYNPLKLTCWTVKAGISKADAAQEA